MREELKTNLSLKNFFMGISLSNSQNYDSSIAVLNKNKQIISMDKFYDIRDLEIFLDNYNSINETVFCASLPTDSSLLEGKWRIHSKNYKMLNNKFEVNKNNWTNRISKRGCEGLTKYKEEGAQIFRFDISQLRAAYKLAPTYLLRSSFDCKSLLTALKIKYDFKQLPENMPPASNLEALLGAMFAYDISQECKTQKVFEFEGIDVLFKV
jgi:hypothetical protein